MRLIDADKLIEEGWVLERHGQSNRLVGVKSIADVPTAFDLDKVVEQLEKAKNPMKLLSASWLSRKERVLQHKGYCKAVDDAIEIIRKGGIGSRT